MNTLKHNLKNKEFGYWKVIEYVGGDGAKWKCKCSCGTTKNVPGFRLRSGQSKSCGCRISEIITKRNFRHGMTGTKSYMLWWGMMQRCYDENHQAFKHYGGRGIKVCKRWHKFENFFADMGERPKGKSLDRKNNDGNYAPSNCKWSTYVQQHNNTRTNRLITWKGKTQTLSQWSRELKIKKTTLKYRLDKGFPINVAFQSKRITGKFR